MTGLTILVALCIIMAGVMIFISPGRPVPLRDATGRAIAGSLSERVFVQINGTRQGMIIQGVAPSNPVILFLHGGPGMPTFFLNTTHPTGLERHFTVVWWEQRGAGMSFDRDLPPASMTVQQMIADTVAVTDYLRDRFGQDRIYLLGHSWGSFLGIQAAAAAPDRFHAYIGMGQLSHQLRAEVAAHDYLLDAYEARGDAGMVAKLRAAPVSMTDGTSEAWMRLRDAAMHGAGVGTTHDMRSVITGIFLPVMQSRAYTLSEKINIWRGKANARRILWEEVLRTDLSDVVNQLEIPTYFFIGRHDHTVGPALARDYFQQLRAPVKGFYTFENAAHSPLFEEPERAISILLQDVTRQRTDLADP